MKATFGLDLGSHTGRLAVAGPDGARLVASVEWSSGIAPRSSLVAGTGFAATCEAIASMVRVARAGGQAAPGETVGAVLSVPAALPDVARRALRSAAIEGGLAPVRLIGDTTAVALAFAFERGFEGRVAVVDFGGGACDVGIVQVGEGFCETLAIRSTLALGGSDLDARLAHALLDDAGYLGIPDAEVLALASQARVTLSTRLDVRLDLPLGDAQRVSRTLSRDQLEERVSTVLDRLAELCQLTLADSGLRTADLDALVLAGGMARMPAVRRVAGSIFEQRTRQDVEPTLAAVRGAALHAARVAEGGAELLVLECLPWSIWLEADETQLEQIFPRGARYPATQALVRPTHEDGMSTLRLRILRHDAASDLPYGELAALTVDGLERAPAGLGGARLTFRLDLDGVLTVEATDAATGRGLPVRLEPGRDFQPVDD